MIAMEFYFPGGATELKFSDLAPRSYNTNIFTAEKCTLQLTSGRIYLNFALNINGRNMLEQSLKSTSNLCLRKVRRFVFNCQLWGSGVVLCYLFLVLEFGWCFNLCLFIMLLVRFVLLSDHLLGNICPLSWPFVLVVFCLFVIFVISQFGFERGVCL